MAKIPIQDLLSKTEALADLMFCVRESFGLIPDREHIGTCINYSDLLPMRTEFIEELCSTAIRYVYSQAKEQAILQGLTQRRDESSARELLSIRARKKFRSTNLQGQFSELLLFNLLQHHFGAAPLLRKMPLTTDPAVERGGADAIHLGRGDGRYRLFIGEAKTYGGDAFLSAFRDAYKDAIRHYKNHRSELDLYVFEDFIPPELEAFARRYLGGEDVEVEVHLVALVAYESAVTPNGTDRAAILDGYVDSIRKEAARVRTRALEKNIPAALRPRMNYILFPIKALDDLLAEFSRYIGGTT